MTLSDRCRRGHLFNEKNTGLRVRNGKTFRICRKCQSLQKRFQYENNDEFRERKKAMERQRHRDNKAIHAMQDAAE